MNATEKSKLLAVIRVRGRVNVRQSIAETLNRLRLKRVNNLALLNTSDDYIGMVRKCKDFVTYGEISREMLIRLFASKNIKVKEDEIDALLKGEKTAKDLKIDIPIRLHPPRHGYESVKKGYKQGGSLGDRGEEINKLIARMV
jgi:large subunit ribosomal protein L30